MKSRDAPGVFDAWAREGRADGLEAGHLPTAAPVLDTLSIPAGGLFLDVGCGTAFAGRRVRARIPTVRRVAVDASAGMLRRAREIDWNQGLMRADAMRIPLHDAQVDAAFSMEVLYYLSDPEAALAEVWRVLRPGAGLVALLDFYDENPYSIDWPQRMDLPMVRWSSERWAQAFEAAGFEGVTTGRAFPDAEAAAMRAKELGAQWAKWAEEVGSLVVAGDRPA